MFLNNIWYHWSAVPSDGTDDHLWPKDYNMKVYIYSKIVEVGVAININILSLQMRWIDCLIK